MEKKRVLWLINEAELIKGEVELLSTSGIEVYIPKILPNEIGFSTTASYDKFLTLPKEILQKLNCTDFYSRNMEEQVFNIINEYLLAV